MQQRREFVPLLCCRSPKGSSHFDLPIALGLMAALGAMPADALADLVALGELNLDGTIARVASAPQAASAQMRGEGLDFPCR
ncbi:hypothetical protein ISN39_20790 [Rhizobium sp. 007]|nr:hypothetical protein ISN39_20790 [Rhizobium sp. 007]